MLKFHRRVMIPSSSSGPSLLQCGWRNLTFQRLRNFGREESEHERGFGGWRGHLRLGKGITVMAHCCNLLMLVRDVLSLAHGSMWKAQFSRLYVFVLCMGVDPLWLNICRLNYYPLVYNYLGLAVQGQNHASTIILEGWGVFYSPHGHTVEQAQIRHIFWSWME